MRVSRAFRRMHMDMTDRAMYTDPERLEVLARLALRLGTLPKSETAVVLLPALVTRVVDLDPDEIGKVSDKTIEHLFQVSLTIGALKMKMSEDMREMVAQIGRRIRRLDGEVGEWMRRETRCADWEAMRSV